MDRYKKEAFIKNRELHSLKMLCIFHTKFKIDNESIEATTIASLQAIIYTGDDHADIFRDQWWRTANRIRNLDVSFVQDAV